MREISFTHVVNSNVREINNIPIGNIKKWLVIYFTNVAIDDVGEGYFTHCYKKAQLYTQFLVREDLYLHPIVEKIIFAESAVKFF